jgi:outer membrane protein assembly factor BamE (lipoprotein component of BamABCDE complex)/ketosteroid isomerase-like protein
LSIGFEWLSSPAYLIGETTWYITDCSEYTDYKVNPMRNSIFFVLVVASLESGCGAKLPSVKPFKMEVQQGNVVTSKMLLQLRPGMTRSQVRYIMGTPLIVDSFRDNRWDYFYELRKEGKVIEKRRVILDFDKDSLASVRGDVIPSAENPEVKTIAETPQKKSDEAKDQSWTDRLKFWQSEENAAADKAAATTTGAAPTTAAVVTSTEAAPTAQAQPAEASKAQPTAETSSQPATKAVAEEEVVPYIPEGEYQAAPTPEEMAKGNLDATANQVTEAKAHPVTEKEMAAQIADTVEPPPVFQQEPMAAAAVAPEPEPVLPPPVQAAPAATSSATAIPATTSAATTSAATSNVAAPVVAAATAAVVATKPAESKPVESKATVKETTSQKTKVQKATIQKQQVQKQEVQKPVAQASSPASATVEDDEVIPYIPEGEYVAPVIPTEADMVKGNMAEANTPFADAEARQVTEKGVAPTADTTAEPSPTFVAEQLPEPEPEPELPPPPPPSVSKPVVKEVAPVAALAATEEKSVAAQPAIEETHVKETQAEAQAKPAEPLPAAAAVTTEAPAGDAEINQALAGWAQAWRSKDIKSYLAAYAPDFAPDGLPSKKAWEAQRKQRLSAGQGAITLVINHVQIQRDGATATVQFEQKYAAKAYKDELAKTLEMRYEPTQKRWLITRERVAPLVASASLATPALTTPPAKVDIVEPSPATTTATPVADVGVESAIDAWAQAWRNKNISAYLAAYSPEFVPEGLPNKSAWEAQRKKRLSPQQGKISLDITNVSVTRDGDSAVATFTQKYAARAYKDEMVKRLQLKLDTASNRWLIVRETTASGAEVPAGKQQVTAPEGSSEHLDGVLEQIGF